MVAAPVRGGSSGGAHRRSPPCTGPSGPPPPPAPTCTRPGGQIYHTNTLIHRFMNKQIHRYTNKQGHPREWMERRKPLCGLTTVGPSKCDIHTDILTGS